MKRIVLAALIVGLPTIAHAQPTPEQIEAYQQGLVRGAAMLQQQIDAQQMARMKKQAVPAPKQQSSEPTSPPTGEGSDQ